MRCAIVGAGAMGTLFARLFGAVAHVGVIGRDDDPAPLGEARIVLLAVKTYDTLAALARVVPALHADAALVVVQNGIDSAATVRACVGASRRVIAAITSESATRLRDGGIARGGIGTTVFPAEREADPIAALFVRAGLRTERRADFATAVWTKAIANAAINPTTALAGVPNGALASDPLLRAEALALAHEAALVARAEGIVLERSPEATVLTVVEASATNRSSMLQDLEAGRPTEIDALVGAIVRRAERAGIAVPRLAAARRAVLAREPRT
jgi:2-dehydropantoate 2-reductase